METQEVARRGHEGVTPEVRRALIMFERELRAAYGERIVRLVLFGSRARADARRSSDVDVAVLLMDPHVNIYSEKMAMADLAYDAIVETGIHVQPWPVSWNDWKEPAMHTNPALIHAMRRDAVPVGSHP